jgi:hypothetical protein
MLEHAIAMSALPSCLLSEEGRLPVLILFTDNGLELIHGVAECDSDTGQK